MASMEPDARGDNTVASLKADPLIVVLRQRNLFPKSFAVAECEQVNRRSRKCGCP